MENDLGNYSDDMEDYLKDPDDVFDYDDDMFDDSQLYKNNDKKITEIHQKLMGIKTKFEKASLFGLMDLNSEYLNYYNSLKTVMVDDNVCILDVPIVKMDIEQVDAVIKAKQAKRVEPVRTKKSESLFKWRFKY